MNQFLYLILKTYVKIATRFYFSSVKVYGKEKLKGNGPFLFVANHQNAFMDGILVVISNSFNVNTLIRADIFRTAFARIMLNFLKLMPVYRIRDGWDSLGKNQQQFDDCVKLFLKKESVLIFPEGNHGFARKVRPLSKGFARIAFEAQRQHPELQLEIVPVGINYAHHWAFNRNVSVYFGSPIRVSEYYKETIALQANLLKEEARQEIEKLMVHIGNAERYDEILEKLDAANSDYSNPIETNDRIKKIESGENVSVLKSNPPWVYRVLTPLKPLAWLINSPIIFGWHVFKKRIKDLGFLSSMKFGYAIAVAPLYYLMITGISAIWIGWWCWLVYAGLLGSVKILKMPS